nr:hypothetical protein [Frankia sp. Cas3]
MKERVAHTARHFAMIPLRVTLHQQTLICGNEECPRGSFVEDVAFTAPGGRVTLSALDTMGHLVGDGVVAVDVVARWAGMSWHTMHGGFIAIAEQAGITVTDPSFAAEALAEAVLANEQLADLDLADPDLGDEVAGGAPPDRWPSRPRRWPGPWRRRTSPPPWGLTGRRGDGCVRCSARCPRCGCLGWTTSGAAVAAPTRTPAPTGGSPTPTAGRPCLSTRPAATACSVPSRAG